jgi:hypothetical protein
VPEAARRHVCGRWAARPPGSAALRPGRQDQTAAVEQMAAHPGPGREGTRPRGERSHRRAAQDHHRARSTAPGRGGGDPERGGMRARGGARKRGLNRALADAALAEIRRMLAYKTRWYGSTLVEADRWFRRRKPARRVVDESQASPSPNGPTCVNTAVWSWIGTSTPRSTSPA